MDLGPFISCSQSDAGAEQGNEWVSGVLRFWSWESAVSGCILLSWDQHRAGFQRWELWDIRSLTLQAICYCPFLPWHSMQPVLDFGPALSPREEKHPLMSFSLGIPCHCLNAIWPMGFTCRRGLIMETRSSVSGQINAEGRHKEMFSVWKRF